MAMFDMDIECCHYVQRLDAVQRCALRLVGTNEHQQSVHFTSLKDWRDVSALIMFHKAQVQGVPKLGRLSFFSSRATLTSYKLITLKATPPFLHNQENEVLQHVHSSQTSHAEHIHKYSETFCSEVA